MLVGAEVDAATARIAVNIVCRRICAQATADCRRTCRGLAGYGTCGAVDQYRRPLDTPAVAGVREDGARFLRGRKLLGLLAVGA